MKKQQEISDPQESFVTRVQKYSIDSSNKDFRSIKSLSFHSARLYNVALYSVRQYYFNNNEYLNFAENYHEVKGNENYRLLLCDIGQLIIRLVDRDMKSFFSLLKLKNRGKYSEKVRMPRYKDKEKGCTFTIHGRALHRHENKIWFSLTQEFRDLYSIEDKKIFLNVPRNIKNEEICQVRFVPKFGEKEFDVEFVYKKEKVDYELDKEKFVGIDCGLSNLATIFDPNSGSFIIDGRPIKSINRYYNKKVSELKSQYYKQNININTKRFIRLSKGRKNKINDYFNKSVDYIIRYCLENNVGNLVVGDMSGIKDSINIGRVNNQNFVSVPHGVFKAKLKGKCEEFGIDYHFQEESYTSKCSALDLEDICEHDAYIGKRVKRGLFKTGETLVNADVNGAANILRKCKLNLGLPSDSVRAVVTRPLRVNPLRSPQIYSGERSHLRKREV